MAGQVVVGSLRINLQANTASFQSELQKAGGQAKQTASEMQNSFNEVNFTEARGGLMFLEESIGVRLPRHLNSLLATLPGVGQAMALAFPILGAVVLIEKIVEAVTKFGDMKEKIHSAAAAYEELSSATGRHAQAIELDNLKLADQLRVLQGKVTVNGPAIALEEARIKAEELTAQLQKAIETEKTLLEKQSVGFWKGLLGDARTDDITKPIIDAKEAIGELERQQGVALQAHDKAAADSIQKELDLKRLNLAIWIQNQQDAEDGARKAALAKDANDYAVALAARKASDPAHSASLDKSFHEAGAQAVEKTNTAYATRASLLSNALMELKAETAEERAQVQNAQLHLDIDKERDKLRNVVDMTGVKSKINTGSSYDSNGKFVSPEDTKKKADQAADLAAASALNKAHLYDASVQTKVTDELDKQRKVWQSIEELTQADGLAAQIHNIKMQEAAGIITKIQADAQIILKTAEAESKAEAKKNDAMAKQLALVQQLSALTNGGTSGSDADKAAYAKAIADYQAFLLQKEKAKATSDAKIYKAEEDQAARNTALQMAVVNKITSSFNSGVASWVNGQNTFGQAFMKSWQGMAQTAVMSIIEMGEQELIGLALHKSVAADKKLTDAKSAFHGAYAAVSDIPIIGPVLAPIAGATAFAAVMAFNKGGDVPGVGFGDSVPAMLAPREMVLDTALADVVRGAASHGVGGNNGNARNATYAPTINAGMASAKDIDEMLKGHFDRWARSEARKRYSGA